VAVGQPNQQQLPPLQLIAHMALPYLVTQTAGFWQLSLVFQLPPEFLTTQMATQSWLSSSLPLRLAQLLV
jgi:hypothetical protein